VLAAALAIVPLSAAPAFADDALRATAKRLFGSVAAASAAQLTSPEAELGRALFWDTRLSADSKTACASCHAADAGGADARRVSIDAKGKATPRRQTCSTQWRSRCCAGSATGRTARRWPRASPPR
jgi:cytochrome c peroxidase